MSQTTAINFAHLEEFLDQEGQTEEEAKVWYDKLSEYEIEGSETLHEIELLYNGARYLMSFAFTAAEELRDVAEQEAVAMAEKEDQWDEQNTKLKEEIESLRERITSKAEIGDSTEAFRAQIDSLKEENRQLQQSNRDRDREMADQRDRFENLASRVDALTRERDALSDHKIHLEDTIRELNRRLSSKTEDTGADWESKKLKLRNEQVSTMSRQMQAVISQNDELREEIDRVSDALEEATRIIEQSTVRYVDLTKQLEGANQRVSELVNQNQRLTEGLPDELIEKLPKCMSAAEKLITGEPIDKINFLQQVSDLLLPNFLNEADYKTLQSVTGYTAAIEMQQKIDRSEEKIHSLHDELSAVIDESNKLRLMIREDRTGEKEAELEQLKKELMAATTLARNLFGEAMSTDSSGKDPTTSLQMRILQLEHSVELLNESIEEKNKLLEELQVITEQKDESNAEIMIELNALKDKKFGSSREEINRLEKQMKFRDEQISKLQQHCTLLQVELGRYADNTYEPPVKLSRTKVSFEKIKKPKPTPSKREDKEEKEDVEKESQKPETDPKPTSPKVVEDEPEKPTIMKRPKTKPKPEAQELTDIATQAVLISNLYYEMMQLLEELSQKDEMLVEMEKSWKDTKRANDDVKAQLELAYSEIKNLKKEQINIEETTLNDMKEAESMELQRLIESINIGGNELERRMGEVTRKLITERMERIRLSRQCAVLKTKNERVEYAGRRLRDSLKEKETNDQRTLTKMKYELDCSIIEIGRLQNRILQSVPIDDYDKLMRKYKKIVKETSGVETNNENIARQELSIFTQPPREAEIEARENMLKKMIDVVSDQSDFWNKECGMLQAENEELKKFIEDVENESDLKSVLGAVERRLLDTIRELRENEREFLKEKKKQRGQDSENTKDSDKLKRERVALLNVINILQRENKLLRDQSMGTVSLQQLEVLRLKIIEARENESQVAIIRSEAEKMKENLEIELLRARAFRAANEVISSDQSSNDDRNNEVGENVSRQLQMAFFSSSQQSAKCKSLEKSIHLKERQMAEMNEELRELKQWNIELLTSIEHMEILKEKLVKVEVEASPNPVIQEVPKEQIQAQSQPQPQVDPNDKESDYESDIRSESSTDRSNDSDRVIVRTIVRDNVEAFEHQIKDIKISAQLAIQGYKEQLELKDIAIERYKQMLNEKIEQGVEIIEKVEIVHHEVEVPDKETIKKLKELQNRMKKVESENRHLKTAASKEQKVSEEGEEREKEKEEEQIEEMNVEKKEYAEAEVQTDDNWQHDNDPPPTTNRNNTNEDIEEPSKINSAKSGRVRKLEEEIQIMQEIMAKHDSQDNETIRQKSEIRDLKGRVQRLTRANKELMITCEQIKEDALAELSTFRRNNDNSDERRMTDLRVEVEKLRTINKSLRLSNEELKNELNKLRISFDSTRGKKIDPTEWERKKRQDELTNSLREKLRKSENNEKEMLEKLEKRDRVIEKMRKDQSTRALEIEKLNRRMKETDPAVIKLQINNFWQQKVTELDIIIRKKEEENTNIQKTLSRIRNEFENFKMKKSEEIKDLVNDNNDKIRKMREELKHSIPIKPKLVTKSSQTDKLPSKKPKVVVKKYESENDGETTSRTVIQTQKITTSTMTSTSKLEQDQSTNEINSRTKTEYEELKKLFNLTEDRLLKSQEKLIEMEKDYINLSGKFERLQIRMNRDEKPTGAVLVLSDKLAAKDREIAQLKHQIAHLQRTVNFAV